MAKLNKKDVTNNLASKVEGMTKKDAAMIIDVFAEVIKDALVNGDSITIPGIVTLSVVDKPEKTGIIQMGDNKGDKWVSPAHKAPKAKFSATIKDALK